MLFLAFDFGLPDPSSQFDPAKFVTLVETVPKAEPTARATTVSKLSLSGFLLPIFSPSTRIHAPESSVNSSNVVIYHFSPQTFDASPPALVLLPVRFRLSIICDMAICTKPLARQTLRMRYFRHYGLPQRHESLFAFRL